MTCTSASHAVLRASLGTFRASTRPVGLQIVDEECLLELANCPACNSTLAMDLLQEPEALAQLMPPVVPGVLVEVTL